MQSRLLKSFLAVADKSSITEAAAALNVSQPALTKSIKQLEADLGVTLFERTSTGVSLTRFGSVLQHHAKIMENEYRHALSRIDDLKGGDAAHNAAIARAVLAGESGPVRDIVVLNAAAGLVSWELARDPAQVQRDIRERFAEKIAVAAATIDSGAATAKLDDWAAATRDGR